ncbi:hypothetical protein N7468_003725 [Penicillium chermesinum]|uniref:Uncharacterized protein n=1 Tax=Penicillium chermesinum TaxID=63820 RepID=A0A9W9TRV8_9EURO|nr:uncharacterized protein N7468_003725 [Penicillium chermesinum]KAJ5239106.1 hypothetical protein N7468_003725 [Penicillium chermesinum]KAJ6164746.1 hypothetical protein N7470_003418 [Penicillium chermesinum]
MQITSLLVSACLALSATVDAIEPFDIVPAVQKRLNSLDLGYTRTHNLLQNFGNPLVSPEFVYQIYNQTVATGTQDLGLAQPVVIDPTTQLILCQAYHNVGSSICWPAVLSARLTRSNRWRSVGSN